MELIGRGLETMLNQGIAGWSILVESDDAVPTPRLKPKPAIKRSDIIQKPVNANVEPTDEKTVYWPAILAGAVIFALAVRSK